MREIFDRVNAFTIVIALIAVTLGFVLVDFVVIPAIILAAFVFVLKRIKTKAPITAYTIGINVFELLALEVVYEVMPCFCGVNGSAYLAYKRFFANLVDFQWNEDLFNWLDAFASENISVYYTNGKGGGFFFAILLIGAVITLVTIAFAMVLSAKYIAAATLADIISKPVKKKYAWYKRYRFELKKLTKGECS